MKCKEDDITERILILIKLDAERLYQRIKNRKSEYIKTFALKRTREHFNDIFKNRYKDVSISELKCCDKEVIVAADQFYSTVDNFCWYLNHTEDMPATVEDKINQEVRQLAPLYETLSLYIDANLGVNENSRNLQNDINETQIMDHS